MECDQCFPSEPFVMPIVGQFLGAVSCFCRSSDQCFPSEPFVMPIVGQFLGAVSCFCRSSGPPATFFEKLAHCH